MILSLVNVFVIGGFIFTPMYFAFHDGAIGKIMSYLAIVPIPFILILENRYIYKHNI